MTTLPSKPADAEPNDTFQAPRTARAEVTDARTMRQISRAEQDRLNADAKLERRARAAKLNLELHDARRAAARRERDAAERENRERRKRRQGRRAARWARLTTAIPQVAEWALFTLPIVFPMAVAWVGQIRFAMDVMHWPPPAAVVFAAGFELSTAYVARLDWHARAAGDSSLLFRAATWGFATGAAIMNYWHAAGPNLAPTGEAVSYSLMSLTGVILWELLSTYQHRTRLRTEGKLPAARPRFGMARWLYMRPLTRIAWLLTVRDGYTTTDLAWRAAVDVIEQYGSAKLARKAIRRGHPTSRPAAAGPDSPEQAPRNKATRTVVPPRDSAVEPNVTTASSETNTRDETTSDSETGHGDETAIGDETDRSDEAPVGRETKVDDGTPAGRKTNAQDGSGKPIVTTRRGSRGQSTSQRGNAADAGGAAAPKARRGGSGASLRAQMLAYAQDRIAQGAPITGKELDVAFNTNNYGSRVLREFARMRVDDG